MKFTISRLECLDLINRVASIVSVKPVTPILGNVLIEAYDSTVQMTTSDQLVGIRCTAQGLIEEEGRMTLPMHHFAKLMRQLTTHQLEIHSQGLKTEIITPSSSFTLRGAHAAEFPALPTLTGAQSFSIPQGIFKHLLLNTMFAASRDDTRYLLGSVMLTIQNSEACFVAIDGRRLARTLQPLVIDPAFSASVCIPIKAVEEIASNLTEDLDEMATVSIVNDRIAVECNHVTLISKLLEGEYPAYWEIIPAHSPIVLSIHREEFTALLRQIVLFCSPNSLAVRFCLERDKLVLIKHSPELGEGVVNMPVDYQGEPLEIAFSPQSLLEIIRHCKGNNILIGLTDAYNPFVITDPQDSRKTQDTNRDTPFFILMPMALLSNE